MCLLSTSNTGSLIHAVYHGETSSTATFSRSLIDGPLSDTHFFFVPGHLWLPLDFHIRRRARDLPAEDRILDISAAAFQTLLNFAPNAPRFKDPAAMKQLFTNAGVDWGKPIVTSCGTGVTASVLALALHLVDPQQAVSSLFQKGKVLNPIAYSRPNRRDAC